MNNLFLLLSCAAIPASAQVSVRPVAAIPAFVPSAAASFSAASAQNVLPVASPAAAFVAPTVPVSAAVPLPITARAALVEAAPALTNLPANASGESQSSGGRIVFDAAAIRAENKTPVIVSAAGEAPAPLKSAAAAKKGSVSAAAFAPIALAATTASSDGGVIPWLVMGAFAIGIFLLLRWSKNNLRKITEEEIKEFKETIEARKAEWLGIPGVKSIEIVGLNRMDDTPPAYLKITVDHIGPDNKDLLPQHHEKWSPVIASMFPASLREAARIASLDGKGYWPIAVTIAR